MRGNGLCKNHYAKTTYTGSKQKEGNHTWNTVIMCAGGGVSGVSGEVKLKKKQDSHQVRFKSN